MKKQFVLLWFFTTPAFSLGTKVIQENKAMEYFNQDVTLCGWVKQVNITQSKAYLNLGGIYPNHKLSFAISKEDYPAFLNKFGDFEILQNKHICAKGIVVQDRRGRPRINVEDPHILRFMK